MRPISAPWQALWSQALGNRCPRGFLRYIISPHGRRFSSLGHNGVGKVDDLLMNLFTMAGHLHLGRFECTVDTWKDIAIFLIYSKFDVCLVSQPVCVSESFFWKGRRADVQMGRS